MGLSHHRFLSKLGLFLVTFSAFCFHSSFDPTRNLLSEVRVVRVRKGFCEEVPKKVIVEILVEIHGILFTV